MKWHTDRHPTCPGGGVGWGSAAVLLATYARCIEGKLPDLKRRLEAAVDLPEPPSIA
ncbi:integrase [Streptomyces violarus]|uniref:integrase n=1 Tax=Streptomyces violarus TaxID=67380 RepID=UPI0021BF3017|nr:integrase [Streptomyces violarus]MCT9139124.1 integrase [Streptomyces violarus]